MCGGSIQDYPPFDTNGTTVTASKLKTDLHNHIY